MDRIERIEKTRLLQEQQNEIIKQLDAITSKLELNKVTCSHVGAFLGSEDDSCKCVLCNKVLDNSYTMKLCANELMIHAPNYLNHMNSIEKFDTVQTMYLGFCNMHPNKSDREIVAIFNKLIIENIKINSDIEKAQRKRI